MLDTYRIFRGADSTTEWAQVTADPDATEGQAIVATLDTMSSVWGVLGQIGGSSMMDDMACMADIVVTGSDVDGLEVLVWRTGSGNRISSPRSSNILWKGTTDATGQVSLTVNNSGSHQLLRRNRPQGRRDRRQLARGYSSARPTVPVSSWPSVEPPR